MSSSPFADAVVVAAGSSRRMGGIDKLQLDLAGRPVLAWSVAAMRAAGAVRDIIVVTGADRVDGAVRAAVAARRRRTGHRRRGAAPGLGRGGCPCRERGGRARPRWRATAGQPGAGGRGGGGGPAAMARRSRCWRWPTRSSGSRATGSSGVAPRDGLGRAQTPQGARRELLLAAVEAHADGPEVFGDEAELLARDGAPVRGGARRGDQPQGDPCRRTSRWRARSRRAGRSPAPRYATGSDSHPFGPGDGLRLGGIEIAGAPRLWGHSDGDAALHAICDALLAARGLGDLGRAFPAGDPATRGIDSRELLRAVVERLAGARARAGVDRPDHHGRAARGWVAPGSTGCGR